jgi:polysaccharide export outer membrane protein
MFGLSKFQNVILAACIVTLSLNTFAQSMPAGIPPSVLSQLQAMTPAQQQALAEKYGFSIPNASSMDSQESAIGMPGEQLTPRTDSLAAQTLNSELEAWFLENMSQEEPDRVRYGQSLFDSEISTFAPTDNAPVPGSYRLGVGDSLTVQLFGKENEEVNLQIGRTGDVTFPRLGSITLSGLTFEDARDLIKTRVAQQLIGVDAVVSMGRLRAINIFMAGEVAAPGAYSVSALTTVTQALFQAGGVTDIGSLRAIEVRRNNKAIARFDSYELLLKGNSKGDIRLTSGDVVYVPPFQSEVDVTGAVKRPMVYELLGGETAEQVIAMAGSFSRTAFPASTLLVRTSDDQGLGIAQTIDLTSDSGKATSIKSGDVLSVPEIGDLISNSVALKGAVTRPGNYGWFPGKRISDLIGDSRRDLAPDADLKFGMIVRQKNALRDIEVIDFEPAAVILMPKSELDPELNEFDEVLIFSLVTADLVEAAEAEAEAAAEEIIQNVIIKNEEELDEEEKTARGDLLEPVISKLRSQARENEPVQLVSVSGAVRAPGTYPLTKGASIATLINAAGGLADSAFLQVAELRRLTEQLNGEIVSEYIDINLGARTDDRNLTIQSRDHLTIRNIPDWSPTDEIIVEGEVTFPGRYRIKQNETIAEVVARAGGLTSDASPESAIFTRESLAVAEAEQAAQFTREIQTAFATRLLTEETTSQSMSDVNEVIEALKATEGIGRLLIDLPSALSGDRNANIVVTDGDRLIIPKISNTVTVIGEVKRAGTHTFQDELSLDDYIDLSAGFTRRADDGGIYVVKGNGSVVNLERDLWRFTSNDAGLDPGDTIVVPINTQYKESLASWREITQIVYQSVVSIAAVARL